MCTVSTRGLQRQFLRAEGTHQGHLAETFQRDRASPPGDQKGAVRRWPLLKPAERHERRSCPGHATSCRPQANPIAEFLGARRPGTRDLAGRRHGVLRGDERVPAENSLLFAAALARAGTPYELHVFPEGEHGLGLAQSGLAASACPGLCATWLAAHGFGPRP
ncbi:prolyl oligopeptidase family serine peptidase [Nonomuraea sp. NPDC050680]|uniref:prolyl oligopeptidase family serine peptidase n=1 Tax=Nonomuraea sp. NPDC050680 TaxID=3154630 RepID=UPI003411A0DE